MARREMNTVCRLCLGDKVQLLHVFESTATLGWTAADAILELLQMQCIESDVYSKFICAECMEKLVDFKVFKHQCQINKDSLDLEYSTTGEVGDNKDVVGIVLCGNENQSEVFLKQEDVEVPIEKDPLDLSEEQNQIKAEIEDTSNDYNEVPSAEVIGSADQAPIKIKFESEDQLRTVGCNEINMPHNTSAEAVTSNEEIPDVVGIVLCGNENHSDIFVKEEDVEVPVEKDPLDLSEEGNEVKAEIEETSNDYDEVSSAEVIGSDDNALIQRSEFKDQHRTEDCNEINAPHNTSSEAMTSNEGIPEVRSQCANAVHSDHSMDEDVLDIKEESYSDESFEEDIPRDSEAESTTGESYNTGYSEAKKLRPHMSDETSNAYSSGAQDDHGGPIGASRLSRVGDIIINEDVVTESIQIPTGTKRNLRSVDVSQKVGSGEKPTTPPRCVDGLTRNDSFSDKIKSSKRKTLNSERRHFKCNQCGKLFPHKSHLNVHLRVHSGEKPFECNVCNKTFTKRFTLKVHMRVHSGEKPYQCKTCSNIFSNKSDLVRHMLFHSGNRSFQCNKCTKSYFLKHHLQRHMITHSR